MCIPVSIRTSNAMANIKGLVDSEATNCFMSPTFIKKMWLGKRPLQKPRKIWNIDNTVNKAGLITHYVNLDIQMHNIYRTLWFLVTNIGNEDLVLGYPWLSTFEPQFNWTSAVINEKVLLIVIRSVNPQIPGKDLIVAHLQTQQEEHHQIRATTSTELAIQAQQYTKKAKVPKEYQQFAKVFSEEESKHYPPKCTWDHAIEFKKDTPDAVDCKVYPLNQIEDQAVQKFLKDKLEKGYIHISKSPYTSSFFFICKKDGKL